jgi:hypothetical protein
MPIQEEAISGRPYADEAEDDLGELTPRLRTLSSTWKQYLTTEQGLLQGYASKFGGELGAQAEQIKGWSDLAERHTKAFWDAAAANAFWQKQMGVRTRKPGRYRARRAQAHYAKETAIRHRKALAGIVNQPPSFKPLEWKPPAAQAPPAGKGSVLFGTGLRGAGPQQRATAMRPGRLPGKAALTGLLGEEEALSKIQSEQTGLLGRARETRAELGRSYQPAAESQAKSYQDLRKQITGLLTSAAGIKFGSGRLPRWYYADDPVELFFD